jgi:hypothetical protein
MPSIPKISSDVDLRYAQVEELMAGLLDVHEDKIAALAARLRLFRQRGFPPQPEGGSKARFRYGLDAVVRLSLGMKLIDAMVPQEAIPGLIERIWDDVRHAFGDAFRAIEAHGRAAASTSDRPLLILRPRYLNGFRTSKADEANQAIAVDAAVTTAGEFAHTLRKPVDDEDLTAMTIIDLQRLAVWIRDALLATRWAAPEMFPRYGEDVRSPA